jgi:glycosyltransferase involved in cell wall biosynthesis
MENKQKTIGLSMIVKNESHVILRLLSSVYKHIDYWAIVDTGSTDGTQEIIKSFFETKGVPGELLETPWVDFSTCRNIALEAIEKTCDYGIWIDADEEFIPHERFDMKIALNSDMDSISVPTEYGGVNYTRKSIWKCGRNFRWNGPIHEILGSEDEQVGGILEGAFVRVKAEGSSWTDIKKKYTEHAEILGKYTETDPDPRWVFYTAQSWRDATEPEKSYEWYKRRSEMNDGFLEEIFFSLFMMARLVEIMEKDKAIVIQHYNNAHKADPVRGETIKSLVQYLQRMGDWEQAYIYSKYGLRYHKANPYPHRILFLDNLLYEFQMHELHALSCYNTNRKEEASISYWTAKDCIKPGMLNEQQTAIMLNNEKFYIPKDQLKFGSIAKQVSSQNIQTVNVKPRGSNYTPPSKKRKKKK